MRRSHMIPAAILAALGLALPARGARPSFTLAAHAGYAFQEENNLRGKFESGFGFAAPLGPRLSLLIEFSSWTAEARQSHGKLYNGAVTMSPIVVALQFEFLQNSFFFPYATFGGAFVFSRFRIGSYISIPEVQIDQRIENGFAPYLGLGARIAVSRSLSFFSEAAYLRRTAPAQTVIRDMNLGVSREDIIANLRTVLLKFGLKWTL